MHFYTGGVLWESLRIILALWYDVEQHKMTASCPEEKKNIPPLLSNPF